MTYLVSFGGGITSAEALRRTIDRHGKENTVAIMADVGRIVEDGEVVCGEDADMDRFMSEVEAFVGLKILRLKHPKYNSIYDAFRGKRFLGNSQKDPCSKYMKREVINKWRAEHYTPENCVNVLGLDGSEPGRMARFTKAIAPWSVWYPLAEPPIRTKQRLVNEWLQRGIEPPKLYEDGFSHNNCGGFCVKMGLSQARRLWERRPKTYAFHAREEIKFQQWIGKNVTFLRDRRGNKTVPMSLFELEKRFKEGYIPIKRAGEGCGGNCMLAPEDA